MDDQETREELNRLYWESDHSVAEIADRLDISRRALYDGIEPRPTGAPCPECGAALGFRNRTAAESREAECADCGREVKLEVGQGPEEKQGAPRGTEPQSAGAGAPRPETRRPEARPGPPRVEQERAAAPLSPTRRVPGTDDSASAPVLAATLLAGIGLGAAAAYLLRRG